MKTEVRRNSDTLNLIIDLYNSASRAQLQIEALQEQVSEVNEELAKARRRVTELEAASKE
jgi:peptidoglycan hydrolase CwlO-like protein